jgi:hypothetical protein
MRQSNGLIQPANTTTLPAYRMLGIKLENVSVAPGSAPIPGATTRVDTAYTFNVNAYVYAQTGSWFVIPGSSFDERLRGTSDTVTGVPLSSYLDLNNDRVATPNEFIDNGDGVFGSGDFADLNRNGVIDPFERAAILRYSRYNYAINFNGAIAENQTALVNDVGTAAKGAVSDWMNKWATTTYDGTAATPTVTHNRIQYTFDPSVAQGELVNDPGFRLPQTTELYNIS